MRMSLADHRMNTPRQEPRSDDAPVPEDHPADGRRSGEGADSAMRELMTRNQRRRLDLPADESRGPQ